MPGDILHSGAVIFSQVPSYYATAFVPLHINTKAITLVYERTHFVATRTNKSELAGTILREYYLSIIVFLLIINVFLLVINVHFFIINEFGQPMPSDRAIGPMPMR